VVTVITTNKIILHCGSKKPDPCYVFKYLQQISVNINNFWFSESTKNLQSSGV